MHNDVRFHTCPGGHILKLTVFLYYILILYSYLIFSSVIILTLGVLSRGAAIYYEIIADLSSVGPPVRHRFALPGNSSPFVLFFDRFSPLRRLEAHEQVHRT